MIKKNAKEPEPLSGDRRSVPAWLPALLILAVTGVLFLILFFNAREGKIYNPSLLQGEFVTVEKAEVLNTGS